MIRKLFLFSSAVLFLTTSYAQQKVKVACIGNSITAGSGVKDKANFYPAQLQQMLGDKYEVRNFGVSGATLLKNGDKPYWKLKSFTDAKAFQPDIVIIKLGTNDSKPQNWKYSAQFIQDYKDFIAEFTRLDSKPKVWVCYPVPVFRANFGISDSIVRLEFPMLKQVAKSEKVKTINLYKALKNFGAEVPDGVHPNDVGAGQIAKTVYKAIKRYGKKISDSRVRLSQSKL